MRTLEERYNFLIKYIKPVDIDYYEGDALLEMKPLFFQFSANDEHMSDIEHLIDLAIEAKEWDIAHGVKKP